MEEKVTIQLADNAAISRLGLKLALEKIERFELVGDAADGESLFKIAQDKKPDIILIDSALPGAGSFEAIKKIRQELPKTKVVVFTSDKNEATFRAGMSAGAHGYCLKSASIEQLANAIDAVNSGAFWLDSSVTAGILEKLDGQIGTNGNTQTPAANSRGEEEEEKISVGLMRALRKLGREFSSKQFSESLRVSHNEACEFLKEILGQQAVTKLEAEQAAQAAKEPAPQKRPESRRLAKVAQKMTPGSMFADHYKIMDRIGEGGMSIVYDAKHAETDRRVAIKVLRDEHMVEEQSLARFRREARAMSAIQHANLVSIYDSGTTEFGLPYIIMDYLDGLNLEQHIACVDPSPSRLLSIFCQVCDALYAVHRKNLMHRDMKPSNIMVLSDMGPTPIVKLVDFGIAKFMENNPDNYITQPGRIFGTPEYMSPEQCKGGQLDHRTDIYSLGCVMYEVFSGQQAFTGENLYDILMLHVSKYPSSDPFRANSNKLVQALEEPIFKCLEKSVDKRPQTAEELKDMLLNAQVTARDALKI